MRTGVHRVVGATISVALAASWVLALPIAPAGATWPGASGLIVFVSSRDGDHEIFTMTAAGGSVTQLTHNTTPDGDPRWSANGQKIVFERTVDGSSEIFSMNADGSNQRRLTHMAAAAWSPAFSPSGKRIVFPASKNGTSYQLFTMRSDGSELRRLAKLPGDEEWPQYSPNGKKILYDSDRNGNYELWKINADGTHPQMITSDPRNVESSWSPDGQSITFETSRPAGTGDWQPYVMNANGSSQTPLFVDAGKDFYGVQYSPEGSQVLFYSNYSGNYEIYVSNANGTGRTNISNNANSDSSPSWQPT